MRTALVLGLCWFAGPAGAAQVRQPAGIAPVVAAIHARLGCMRDVAAYKFANAVPVQDPAREKVVIEHGTALAGERGLDRENARRLLEALIAAGREIEETWIRDWQEGALPPPESWRDLKREVRPAITAADWNLIGGLAVYLKRGGRITPRDEPAFRRSLVGIRLSPVGAHRVFAALAAVRLAEAKWGSGGVAEWRSGPEHRLARSRWAGVWAGRTR